MINPIDRASHRRGSANEAPAKLRCRNIWKIYGSRPDRALELALKTAEAPESLKRRLEAGGKFLALADVSFEVRQGEIFVVMGLRVRQVDTVRCLHASSSQRVARFGWARRIWLSASERRMVEVRRGMGWCFRILACCCISTCSTTSLPLRMQGIAPAER